MNMAENKSNPNGKLRLHEEVGLPTYGLPTTIQQFIDEIVRVYQCPRDFVVVAVLSVISTAVGNRVMITDRKYKNHPMFWAVNVAIKPLREINQENYLRFEEEYEKWKANKEHDESNPPKFDQLLVGDCTEEARIKVLQNSSHGILGYYPEIKGTFDDMERYNKGGYIDKLLRLYDGDEIYLNRKNEPKPILINNVFMNILGDIQPGLLKATFGSPQFMENGLNQRFLFTMASTNIFPNREIESMDQWISDSWRDIVRQLYHINFQGWELISFSPECDKLYTEYFNSLQRKKAFICETSKDGYILSIYSKLQIQAQRLAAIVHFANLVNCPNSFNFREVSEEEMEYTIRCMDYFESTALMVYEHLRGEMTYNQSPKSQADWIRAFNKAVPIKNQCAFADSIGKDRSYISRVLKS